MQCNVLSLDTNNNHGIQTTYVYIRYSSNVTSHSLASRSRANSFSRSSVELYNTSSSHHSNRYYTSDEGCTSAHSRSSNILAGVLSSNYYNPAISLYFRVLVRTNMVNSLAVLRNFEREGIQDMATKTWLERLLCMRMISSYLKPISRVLTKY